MEDNLLASYFDEKLTPLESIVYKDRFQLIKNSELGNIRNDIKEIRTCIETVKPIEIPACQEYLLDLHKWRELKGNPDDNPLKIV